MRTDFGMNASRVKQEYEYSTIQVDNQTKKNSIS